MRIPLALVLSGLLLSSVSGCGGGGENVEIKNEDLNAKRQTTDKAELKNRLSQMAASGAAGSALAGLKPSIEGLRSSNASLADDLLKDLKQLEQATDPESIKAIAARMAAKL